jgi:DNA-binding transcriptional LysR family regulator
MENFLNQNHISVRKQLELTGNEAVKHAVIAGLGSAIMPLIGIQNELLNGQLHIIPTDGFPIESTWKIIWLKNKQLSPVAKAYLAFLNQQKKTIAQQVFGN